MWEHDTFWDLWPAQRARMDGLQAFGITHLAGTPCPSIPQLVFLVKKYFCRSTPRYSLLLIHFGSQPFGDSRPQSATVPLRIRRRRSAADRSGRLRSRCVWIRRAHAASGVFGPRVEMVRATCCVWFFDALWLTVSAHKGRDARDTRWLMYAALVAELLLAM